MTTTNDNDLALVVEYFRNKAAELEMQNIQLQLEMRKLQEKVAALEPADVPDESAD